uniref:Uncharacterized protein n=1 Tax=Manihot esculenta TaxID=3983 RepID=A0A2C9VJS8_MANES
MKKQSIFFFYGLQFEYYIQEIYGNILLIRVLLWREFVLGFSNQIWHSSGRII